MCITDAIAARDAAKDRYRLAVEFSRTEIVIRYRVEFRQACDRVCEERARLAAEAEREAWLDRDTQAEIARRWTDDYEHEMEAA